MLLSVFDETGEMFEVRPEKAKHLVINEGWSLEVPKVVAAPVETAPIVVDAELPVIAEPEPAHIEPVADATHVAGL